MRKVGTFIILVVLCLMMGKPVWVNAATLTSLAISGDSSVEGGKSATYIATAGYGDVTTAVVTPALWYVTPPTYASISSSGVLTTTDVTSEQTISVAAQYTEGGITLTKVKSVTIKLPSTTTTSLLNCKPGYLYKASLPDGSTGSLCLHVKKVKRPSGASKLRGTASWSGFVPSAESAVGSTFSFAWEDYESDSATGTLHEDNPSQGALFVLAFAYPSATCVGGASFFAVIEMTHATSTSNLGSSLNFSPLFGQICGTPITTLSSYTLLRQ